MWVAAQTTCGLALLEGQGTITARALRSAVEQAALVNPGCRLQLRGHGPWAHWRETGILPEISEVDAADWDGDDGDTAPFSDQAHMDVRHGASLSYVIVHGGERTRIVQRSHHATMDGMGALQFLQDVFRALRQETPHGASGEETDLALAHRLTARPRRVDQRCLSPFPPPSHGESGSIWARHHISEVDGRLLLPRTLAAIAKLARQRGTGEVLIDLPVNLRNSFPTVRNTGNLTGSLRLNIAPTDTPDTLADTIRQQLAEGRQGDAVVSAAGMRFIPLALMRHVAHRQARQAISGNNFSPTAVVSNLGRFDPAVYSTADFQAHRVSIIPPAYDGVPLFLVLSGNHQHGIDLAARAPCALGDNGRLKLLLQELAGLLHNSAQ